MRLIYFLILSTIQFGVLAQNPFIPIDTNWSGDQVIIPSRLYYNILFREGEVVKNNAGQKAKSKGNHDYSCFILDPKSNEDGKLYVSHETNDTSNHLGDGGGGTVFDVKTVAGAWVTTSDYQAIDFSTVGGTFNNCSGFLTTKHTVLTCEEFPPASNKELFKNGKGFRDTFDYNGLKRYQNMGWVVEVDPNSKKALSKIYNMGRFSHEGILVMPDAQTVYLCDDYAPSVFFKYFAFTPNQFSSGQLYAYRQSEDGLSGTWIELPMHMDSLLNIREVALRMGATAFARMEWLTLVGEDIYITETGGDNLNYDKKILLEGRPAFHLERFKIAENKYDYPYGGILKFSTTQNSMGLYLAGGQGNRDQAKHLSNPDAITYAKIKTKEYLVISEDIIGIDKGRVSSSALRNHKWINEIYWLEINNKKQPTVDDLERFLIAPAGAETTGGTFSPDFKTFFVNIQHPDAGNTPPFNKSVTISISDLNKRIKD